MILNLPLHCIRLPVIASVAWQSPKIVRDCRVGLQPPRNDDFIILEA